MTKPLTASNLTFKLLPEGRLHFFLATLADGPQELFLGVSSPSFENTVQNRRSMLDKFMPEVGMMIRKAYFPEDTRVTHLSTNPKDGGLVITPLWPEESPVK